MRRPPAPERGAAVVEFAILLVLILVLLFGIFEFGLLWNQAHYVNSAAREGARSGAEVATLDTTATPPILANSAVVQTAVQTAVIDQLRNFGNPAYYDPNELGKVTTVSTALAFVGSPALPVLQVDVTLNSAAIYEPVLWDLLQLIASGPSAPENLGARATFPIRQP